MSNTHDSQSSDTFDIGAVATDATAAAARRERLRTHLGGRGAVLANGGLVGRNYPGNPYPFRASSHVLYLVGDAAAHLEDAWLLMDDDGDTLFAPLPDADDALWHGARDDGPTLERKLGLKVRPLEDLEQALKGRALATLPAPDAATRKQQAQVLGRDVGELTDLDAPLADGLIACRLRHDAAALQGLRHAAVATRDAHLAGMRATKVGGHEAHVVAAMKAAIARHGMTTAYNPIVSTHGEVLHNHSHDNALHAGDLILADVGAETVGGWAGDVTRTWPVSGKYAPEQKALYDVVLRSQLAAIEKVREGVRYRDVHLEAHRALAEGLVGLEILSGDPQELVADGVTALFFPHGVGHIIGLDVHDMEDLGDRAGYAPGRVRDKAFGLCFLRLDRDLEPGMAVTIEPGFYQVPAILEDEARMACAKGRLNRERLATFSSIRGIRIEDDVVVTTGEPEVLTQAIPKTTAEVEAEMARG